MLLSDRLQKIGLLIHGDSAHSGLFRIGSSGRLSREHTTPLRRRAVSPGAPNLYNEPMTVADDRPVLRQILRIGTDFGPTTTRTVPHESVGRGRGLIERFPKNAPMRLHGTQNR